MTNQHGGARPGAGRPPLPPHLKRIRCGHITLPRWMLDKLAQMSEPAGSVIEAALVEKFDWRKPGNQTKTMKLTPKQKEALTWMLKNQQGNEWLSGTPARHNVLVNLKALGLVDYAFDPDHPDKWIERLTDKGKEIALGL